ncbi:MAG: VCBS repeat-containing protein, partial [Pedobacter sp.]|nr:VCBS repeat-containing protein [Pedobacter sp.]
KDIDGNGSFDAMIFCYSKAEDQSRKQFPMHTRDDMISQVLGIRKKFPTYKAFGAATIDDIWSEEDKKGATILNATDMNSSIMINKGGGNFEVKALPTAAQAAPGYGMSAIDVDQDGNLDLLMVGNDYGMEPFTGRHDAMFGLYLKGDGKGRFIKESINKSGFYVPGDGKAFAQLHSAKGYNLLVASQNQDSLKIFKPNKKQIKTQWIKLQPEDFFVESTINGKVMKTELYYGSTFLSQSTRMFAIDEKASAINIYNFDGKKRRIK